MGPCMSVQRKTILVRRRDKHGHGGQKKLSLRVLDDPTAWHNIYKRYKLGKELGRGEFGVTYECLNQKSGERVACKKISKSKLRTEVDVEDVRREVEIMRHLPKHPNIVSYKEVYEDREAVYLVMEACGGGELFDRIVARGHYTERAAALVTKTILEVVKLCHAHGVIHRDLKPENFLYANPSENAPLKAIDFGLSIFFQPEQRFSEIVGSPYYMAPEVLRRNYGAQVDVWSAGVIVYILLCGVPPFWAETEEGIAKAIVYGEVDLKRDPWPKVSGDAKKLVKGMLDHNPYTRLTVQQVLDSPWIQNAEKVSDAPLGDGVRSRIKQFSLMNKFKKRVLRVVAENLPEEQTDGIKEMFYMMDTDKNGHLSFQELKDGLHMMGQPVPDHDVQFLLDAGDMDGNGSLSCEEFVTLAVHLKKINNEQVLGAAFSYFDKNGSGFIELEELQEALLDDPPNQQVIHDIIKDADLDKDGRISYAEFEAMMMDWKMGSRQYSRAMLNALSLRLFNN